MMASDHHPSRLVASRHANRHSQTCIPRSALLYTVGGVTHGPRHARLTLCLPLFSLRPFVRPPLLALCWSTPNSCVHSIVSLRFQRLTGTLSLSSNQPISQPKPAAGLILTTPLHQPFPWQPIVTRLKSHSIIFIIHNPTRQDRQRTDESPPPPPTAPRSTSGRKFADNLG